MNEHLFDLQDFAQFCESGSKALDFLQRMKCERAVFASAKQIAKTKCDYDLQSFHATSRLDFDQHCEDTAQEPLAVETVRLAFQIVVVLKLLTSGNAYTLRELMVSLESGRRELMQRLGRRVHRYRKSVTELFCVADP